MLYDLHSPLLSVRALGVAAVAPAGYFHADLWLGGYLGISCMPPTAPHSPCSNRPPANYGFPRSQSSRNHYRISPEYEMFSFAPSTVVQLTGDSATTNENKHSAKAQSTQSTETMGHEFVSKNVRYLKQFLCVK